MPSCSNCQNLACRKKVDYQVKAGIFCDHAKLPPWRRNVSAFFLRAAGLCPGWQRKTPEYIEEQRRAKAAEERYAAESAKAEGARASGEAYHSSQDPKGDADQSASDAPKGVAGSTPVASIVKKRK